MKLFLKINWLITIALSIATGLFKVLQQEADIQLFQAIGFSEWMVTTLGVLQLLGGLLLIPQKTRKPAAYLMITTYTIASIAVFANAMLVFGAVSLLFILMSYLVIYRENKIFKK